MPYWFLRCTMYNTHPTWATCYMSCDIVWFLDGGDLGDFQSIWFPVDSWSHPSLLLAFHMTEGSLRDSRTIPALVLHSVIPRSNVDSPQAAANNSFNTLTSARSDGPYSKLVVDPYLELKLVTPTTFVKTSFVIAVPCLAIPQDSTKRGTSETLHLMYIFSSGNNQTSPEWLPCQQASNLALILLSYF